MFFRNGFSLNLAGVMKQLTKLFALALSALFLQSCTGPILNRGDVLTKKDAKIVRVKFSSLPSTEKEDWERTLQAFSLSCKRIAGRAGWKDVCEKAANSSADAKEFFRDNFDVWRVYSVSGQDKVQDKGLMTGYYEPVIQGSREKTNRFRIPLHAVPDDLLTVDLGSVYPSLKKMNLKGKISGSRVIPYDARGAIMKRQDLDASALCWVEDPVEAFFLQIQGSGRILLEDGTFLRLGYADSNGHPYRAIAGWLVKNARMKPSEMSMQRIKQWARENPKRVHELLSYNQSYVFFVERIAASDDEGPIGSLGVALTPQASVAVDRSYWPLGIPFVTQVKQERPSLSFARPVVAQDTGSAIKGPIRFDYFWGHGEEAGRQAGGQKSAVAAWVLSPKGVSPWDL